MCIRDRLKPNDRPVADAGSDQAGFSNTTIQFDGSESHDVDGSIVEYEWNCTSDDVVLSGQNTTAPSFVPEIPGSYVFTLRVRDDNNTWSDPDTVLATIVEPGKNLPPTAHAGKDRSWTLGDTVLLNGSLSKDNDGSIVTWEWNCTSHSGVSLN
jgi:hypothetical protein